MEQFTCPQCGEAVRVGGLACETCGRVLGQNDLRAQEEAAKGQRSRALLSVERVAAIAVALAVFIGGPVLSTVLTATPMGAPCRSAKDCDAHDMCLRREKGKTGMCTRGCDPQADNCGNGWRCEMTQVLDESGERIAMMGVTACVPLK